MGFWIFMLIMELLIPLTMTGFGRLFIKGGPRDINIAFGYRTTMSMKNKDTWEFAHHYCGRLWYVCGIVLLPVSIAGMLLVAGRSENTVGTVGGILCVIQMIPLVGSIIPTEVALRKAFDKNGNRR